MNREARAALLFLAPGLFVLVVFFFLPVLAGFGWTTRPPSRISSRPAKRW